MVEREKERQREREGRGKRRERRGEKERERENEEGREGGFFVQEHTWQTAETGFKLFQPQSQVLFEPLGLWSQIWVFLFNLYPGNCSKSSSKKVNKSK